MKKYRMVIWGMLVFLGMTSCDKYLDVTPKNVISMDDMESIKQSLASFLRNIRDDGVVYRHLLFRGIRMVLLPIRKNGICRNLLKMILRMMRSGYVIGEMNRINRFGGNIIVRSVF